MFVALRSLSVNCLSIVAGLIIAPMSPAYAETLITVTTTLDTVDAGDGLISLREAFDAANTSGDDTRFVLAEGQTYMLCDGVAAPPEDANARGDLDYTAPRWLSIVGNSAILFASCPGERVLHSTDTSSIIELFDLVVRGGAGTSSIDASGLWAMGSVVLDRVTFTANTVGPAFVMGEDFGLSGTTALIRGSTFTGNFAGLRTESGSTEVIDSSVTLNSGSGIVAAEYSGLRVTDSTVADNGNAGINGIDARILVSNTVIRQNGGIGVRNTGNASTGYPLDISGSIVQANRGGVDCSFCTRLTIIDSSVIDNMPRPDGTGGGGVRFATGQEGPFFHVERSTISGNSSALPGGGLSIVGLPETIGSIVDSTVNDNVSTAAGGGGAIYVNQTQTTLLNSTVYRNTVASGEGGGILTSGESALELRYVTLTGNSAPNAANLAVATPIGTLSSFATVIGDPVGGGDNCALQGVAYSAGYNFSTTATCGFGAGPGDTVAGATPSLGLLADNGGPTLTRAPIGASRLIDAIPADACGGIFDQRGVTRPQGVGCDIGAVEVHASSAIASAVDDSMTVSLAGTIGLDVLANDIDPDHIFNQDSLRIVDGPKRASAVAIGGRIQYTASKPGADRFVYEVCGNPPNTTCSKAQVRVVVKPVR